MSDEAIPEDILIAAEKALDQLLCNCKEAGDVRQDSIEDIARAIMAATDAERERCAQIAEAEYEKRFENADGYSASRVHDYVIVARAIERAIRSHPKKLPAGDA